MQHIQFCYERTLTGRSTGGTPLPRVNFISLRQMANDGGITPEALHGPGDPPAGNMDIGNTDTNVHHESSLLVALSSLKRKLLPLILVSYWYHVGRAKALTISRRSGCYNMLANPGRAVVAACILTFEACCLRQGGLH